jgi:hypothetical protein
MEVSIYCISITGLLAVTVIHAYKPDCLDSNSTGTSAHTTEKPLVVVGTAKYENL